MTGRTDLFEQPLPEVVEAEWTLATDSGMRSRVACGVVAASNLLGHSVHVPFHGLRPGRTYYPFRAPGDEGRRRR